MKIDMHCHTKEGSLDGKTLSFKNKNGETDILWEPGATFTTPVFKIKSTGTLAIKYKLALNGVTGDNKLLEVIKFTVVNENDEEVDLNTFVGNLTPDAPLSEGLYIKGHMAETAGNDYQGKELTGLGITVYATQDTVEFDSIDQWYDKDSDYTEVIPGGKTFENGTHVISTGITATDKNAIAVKATGANTNVTITGGTFDGGSGGNNQCVHVANGATVTIQGGTFTVGGSFDTQNTEPALDDLAGILRGAVAEGLRQDERDAASEFLAGVLVEAR